MLWLSLLDLLSHPLLTTCDQGTSHGFKELTLLYLSVKTMLPQLLKYSLEPFWVIHNAVTVQNDVMQVHQENLLRPLQ